MPEATNGTTLSNLGFTLQKVCYETPHRINGSQSWMRWLHFTADSHYVVASIPIRISFSWAASRYYGSLSSDFSG